MNNLYGYPDIGLIEILGSRLKKLRLQKNITQSKLAKMTGLGVSTISNMEVGKPFSMLAFLQVLRALNSFHLLDELFKEEEVVSPMEMYKSAKSEKKRVKPQKK